MKSNFKAIPHMMIAIVLAILLLGQCKMNTNFNSPNLMGIRNPFYGLYNIPSDLNLPLIQNVPNFQNKDSLVLYLQNNADDFSWRTFIATCWPANLDGTPDTNSSFALKSNHVVFEYWMPSHKLYTKDGKIPESWDQHIQVTGNSLLTYIASELRTIPKLNTLEKTEADHHILIDQNRNTTLYQLFYNREAYEYVTNAKLYNLEGQKEFVKNWPSVTRGLKVIENDTQVNIVERYRRAYFSIGNTVDSSFKLMGGDYYFLKNPNSSIIKSAWRVMTDKDDKSRYYIRNVLNDSNQTVEMGLVGLHIVQKVSEATQWIWSSFEHIDNAPGLNSDGLPDIDPNVKYSYFNPENIDTNRINKPNPKKTQNKELWNQPHQIVRINPIAQSTNAINDRYRQKIRMVDSNSVWQYYQLVGTQWPFLPTLFTSGEGYTPNIMANTVLETFEQKNSSCMGCHSNARFLTSDTTTRGYGYNADFIWGLTNVK